jgi:hypothetical protein
VPEFIDPVFAKTGSINSGTGCSQLNSSHTKKEVGRERDIDILTPTGTFTIHNVSLAPNMAAACMTHCNAALDCGAIFIQVSQHHRGRKRPMYSITSYKIYSSAGIFKQSLGARNRVGIGFFARLHRLGN